GAASAVPGPAPARPWWSLRLRGRAAPQSPVEIGDGQGELLWANMALHAVADPLALMREWHRVLAVDGFLMFSTLGPGSLQALSALYAAQGWPAPYAPFVDMHDLGDMLVEAGFADPVMDQETVTLTWASGMALLAELRALGGNVDPRRAPGLRTPRWRQRLAAQLDGLAGADGRVALQFEIVYGHAFRPLPRPRLAAETAVPLADLRTMARGGRRHA
ncbi:MAG: methyltransferase domain-containing protein, partial [Burkholderiales bacterium]|nr:methyltransferase domain-containing protein [Burkholderiales bacterium]